MSEENYDFAEFMQGVPAFRYLPLLQQIVFDATVTQTATDNWNYYGEFIKKWQPDLLELLALAGIKIQEVARQLRYDQVVTTSLSAEFPLEPFGDSFLDHIRNETNKAYSEGLYLAVMFTSRKLIETIVIRLFEVVFPKIVNRQYSDLNHDLWFDKNRNTFQDLDNLLTNLKDNAPVFQEDRDLVLEFVSLARPLKNETNACIHRDYRTPNAAYVDSWNIPHTLRLGRRLFRKYCNP